MDAVLFFAKARQIGRGGRGRGRGTAWGVADGRAGASAHDFIGQVIGSRISLIRFLLDLVNLGALFEPAQAWLLGPALPATASAVMFALATLLFRVPTPKGPLIDRLWPSSPDVLDPKLEEEDVDRLAAAATPFLERDDEMRRLLAFAGGTGKKETAFMVLAGRLGARCQAIDLPAQDRDPGRRRGWEREALAGPLAQSRRREIADAKLSISRLEALLEGEERAVLKRILSALMPERFADEILFRLADGMTEADLARLAEAAVTANGAAEERRLASLRRRRGLTDERAGMRRTMQEIFDRRAADRVETMRQDARRLVNEAAREPQTGRDGKIDSGPMQAVLDDLVDLAEAALPA